ncbi:hypothetical protein NW762_004022 [Fusarium torreyae]|uniref:Uncharacterized protein n=1 Tax=Fusarium torreyae TaxID=1237075 RepID=A0A9W8S5Y6_9HYPO|nr:hypothetical protein NW762_004022 [Fusarium torreyae]
MGSVAGVAGVSIEASGAPEHFEAAITQTYGLSAGFIYLDETEPELSCTHTRQPKTHMSDYPHDLPLELNALFSNNEVPGVQPYNSGSDADVREIALSSIRKVRKGTHILWEHLIDVSHSLDSPVIKKICSHYRDAKGLLQAGVLAFRETMTGPAPSNLVKIFALCSLCYIVSRVRSATDRVADSLILADIHLRMDALGDEDERQAFKVLAQRLWPEARNHVQLIDFDFEAQSQVSVTDLPRGQSPFSPQSVNTATTSLFADRLQSPPLTSYGQQNQHAFYEPVNPKGPVLSPKPTCIDPSLIDTYSGKMSPVSAQNHANPAFEEVSFQFNLGEQSLSTSGPPTAPLEWLNSVPAQSSSFDATMLELVAPEATAEMPYVQSVPSVVPGPDNQSRPKTLDGVEAPQDLCETSTFTVVLQYMRESSSFWYKLAGRGIVSKNPQFCTAWRRERAPQKRRIQASYVYPLSTEKRTRDLPSRGIVSIVETFVEWGWLQDIDDIEYYMKLVAHVSKTQRPLAVSSFLGLLD